MSPATDLLDPSPGLERMEAMVRTAQAEICQALEAVDGEGGRFREDRWERPAGGGGWSRILEAGDVVEKGGVNVATVWGELPPGAAEVMLAEKLADAANRRFAATGLSLVLHPRNPYAPTVHCNYRYFELADGRWWFGGGTDLTPIYLDEGDATHFHHTLRAACDAHDASYYPRFKRWCDDYFQITHRGEARGVGGIFFDDFAATGFEPALAFVTACTQAFLPCYLPILERRCHEPWGEAEAAWQRLRRGRYVEFNLMYDRGTRFGLRTGGRIESILMSLPPTAGWSYDHEPAPGTAEAATLAVLRDPRDWA